MDAPHPDWLPFLVVVLDRLYGFVCLFIIAGLICVIALGDVQEKNSYGLNGLVTIVGGLAIVEKVTGKKGKD